jgi:hypothetical protein
MSWASRAAKNLLPPSREKSDLSKAPKEWRFGGFNDLESTDADCELCDHSDIREIRNPHTPTAASVRLGMHQPLRH